MANQPNILLIMSDQHNPHVMGCAGDPIVRTPNLDFLGDRGVIFDNSYCSCPLCAPSRMAFMTGRHCQDIEVWTNGGYLQSHVPTFAHALGAAGYDTIIGGRMHFLGPDQRHGFHDRIMGDVSGPTPGGNYRALIGLPKGVAGQERPAVEVAGPGRTGYQCFDDAVLGACEAFLKERASSDTENPFLLVAGFVLPHCPFIAPKELYDYYYERVEVPDVPEGYRDNLHPVMKRWLQRRRLTDVTDEETRKARAAYYGLVEYFDNTIGQLLGTLDEVGLADDTVVIYTSDHGDSAGENGFWFKSSFYEGSVSVPLIISDPRRNRMGIRRNEVVSLVDVAPTLTDLAGASDMNNIRGDSLVPLLGDEEVETWRDTAISEFSVSNRGDPHGRMIRSGPWKLMQYYGHEPLLFNLEKDPRELHDRAEDPECSEILERLQHELTDDWDPEHAAETVARRIADREMLIEWRQQMDVIDEDYWYEPEGYTVFPET